MKEQSRRWQEDTAGEVWLRPEAEAKEGEQTIISWGAEGAQIRAGEAVCSSSLPG